MGSFALDQPLRTTRVTAASFPFLGPSRRVNTALFESLNEIETRPRIERSREPVGRTILRRADANTVWRRARGQRQEHGFAVCPDFRRPVDAIYERFREQQLTIG